MGVIFNFKNEMDDAGVPTSLSLLVKPKNLSLESNQL